MLVGAHMSISGGVENAPVYGTEDYDCEVIQIFTGSPRRWAFGELTEENVAGWRREMGERELGPTLVHAMYLLNLADPDADKWERSAECLATELQRADALDIPWVTFHPGSHKSGTREEGLERVARGIDHALEVAGDVDTIPLIETMPGAGTQVGRSFEEIATILDHVSDPHRLAVCFDTCHTFVAGYPLHEEDGYDETFDAFDDILGLDKLKAFHLNDAGNPFESGKDGHASIGEGNIGTGCFERLVNDPRFEDTPGYLETSAETYAKDLETLRGLRH